MNSGNPVPGANGGRIREQSRQQIRDIQDIIAKLELVTKRLAYPLRTMPMPQPRRTLREQAVPRATGGLAGGAAGEPGPADTTAE
jgi:hypothetical protein